MRLYLEMVKNTLQARVVYRSEVVFRLLNGIVILLIQVSIWSALFYGKKAILSNITNINLRDMITYAVLSTVISIIVSNDIIHRVEQKIRSGEIAMDLIKPIDFKMVLLSETIGSNIFRMVFELIPLLVFGILLFGIETSTIINSILFVVTVINGSIILFLLSYISALSAFWYMITWHIEALLNIMVLLFSGSFIPIWFFPQSLVGISNLMPFRLIYFAPISVYLGKVDSAGWIVFQQMSWIIALWIMGKIVWSRAINRLTVQGG